MINQLSRAGLVKVLFLVFSTALLSACGGGSNSSSLEPSSANVSGSVGDGPITGATVRIYNARGELVSTETSDNTAAYKSSFKASSRDYPLILKVSDGIDLVTGDAPDFELVSIMMHKGSSNVNINPFSTLIVKMAGNMAGGINADNIDYARFVIMNQFGFGLDPDIINNPITARISSKTIAHIVKSSEALGEMVRRTRDQLVATGAAINGDDVIEALAADLADGFLDGAGAAGTDPTVSAVANVVTGQVLVEAMLNTLKVNGVVATGVIDEAISITRPTTKTSQLSDSVHITAGMIDQTRQSVAAAQVVDTGDQLVRLASDVDSVSAGSSSADAATRLDANASQWLDNAVSYASTADTQYVYAINQVASATPDTGTPDPIVVEPVPVVEEPAPVVVENTPPTLSGSPSTSVTASNSYSFRPGASDADGDTLSFSISGKPAWASFNASTGKLSGAPAEADVGTYKNIVISVTDGTDTVSLGAFAIQVQTGIAATGSLDLSWTAPVARADGTPLSLADINGFRVYYGAAEGNYTESVDIKDGTAQSTSVTGVPVGTYHVVMTTYDMDGRESGYSASVAKTVQ